MEKAGFHTIKSTNVDAPLIEELPFTLECELVKINEDGNVIGRIVNISADEQILTSGEIDLSKFRPISYDPIGNVYRVVGEVAELRIEILAVKHRRSHYSDFPDFCCVCLFHNHLFIM